MPLPTRLSKVFGRSRESVCYEVSLAIAPDRSEEFDAWLLGHVREMLAFPGFQDARVYRDPRPDENGRERRVVSYEVRSRRELDSYLHTHARRMRGEGLARFGKSLAASREIVPLAEYQPDEGLQLLLSEDEISGGLPICGNCHNPVEGRFCKICGQEDRTYLLSLKELAADFFGELTNFDSRFFRTLKPLLFSPGHLTLDYIRGRRQHYFPPIRLYIIVSILFFFVAAVMTDNGLANANFDMMKDPNENTSAGERKEAIAQLEERLENSEGPEREALRIALASLRAGDDINEASNEVVDATTADTESKSTPGETDGDADRESQDNDATTDMTDMTDMTDISEDDPRLNAAPELDPDSFIWKLPSLRIENGVASASGWGSEEMNQRMARGAEAIKKNPRAFVRTLIDNIPSMMLIFLPLIALVLKLLYIFSGRYYVEHLIFSLHTHSAVFIILLFWMLLGELADSFSPLGSVMGWITAAVWIYIPVYLYKSMRRVYGQGHFFTSTKFFLLSISYVVAASITSVFLFVAAVYQQA